MFNDTMTIDTFEAISIKPTETDLSESLEAFHTCFKSSVKPENGYFGITEVDKGNGLTELTGRNQEGHVYREYLREGKVYRRRVNLGNHEWASIDFDDNGTEYLTTVHKLTKEGVRTTSHQLKPGVTVTKGNFTAQIDGQGRPVLNSIEDLQLRPKDVAKKNLDPGLFTDAFKERDHRGHLIADEFGGPSTAENIVAQLDKVNQGKMREVERQIESLKKSGHRVDYSVKINYVGSDKRPSSFEPHIVVDGEEYELPDDLRKIYNADINDASVSSAIMRTATDLGERSVVAREEGLYSTPIVTALTCSTSTYENVSAFLAGKVDAEYMASNIVRDTLIAGGTAQGSSFLSRTVAQEMCASSNALISRLGDSCLPDAIVSFGLQSFDDISSFARGEIEADELTYNLGENAAEVEGSTVGGVVSAHVDTTAGLPGVVASVATGDVAGPIVGGVVGCAVASEAYATVVELGLEGAEVLTDIVEQLADATVDAVAKTFPDQVDGVQEAFNDFFRTNDLPFSV